MIFKYASTLILLLPSLALNSRIRGPSTYAFQAQKLAFVTELIYGYKEITKENN
jgi:hypothetical protein